MNPYFHTIHIFQTSNSKEFLDKKLGFVPVWSINILKGFFVSMKVTRQPFLRGYPESSPILFWWLIPISHMTTSCAQWVYCTQFFGRLNGVSEMIAGSQQTIVNYVDWKSHLSPIWNEKPHWHIWHPSLIILYYDGTYNWDGNFSN